VTRPGFLARAAAGAWHVPAGIVFLLLRPRLWPLAALPAFLAAVLLLLGIIGGIFAVPHVDAFLTGGQHVRSLADALETAALWVVTPLAGALTGLGLALLLAAPILERLSEAVERELRGRQSTRGLAWEVGQSMRGALYFVVRAPGALLAAFVPFVGPFVAALWGAHVLAFQMTDAPLARRGASFLERRGWHREHRAESLGFGLAAVLTMAVPLVNLLLVPSLAVGATRLVLELEAAAAPE
jgi:uncharacterized protein involved in cysteine biosynthesis